MTRPGQVAVAFGVLLVVAGWIAGMAGLYLVWDLRRADPLVAQLARIEGQVMGAPYWTAVIDGLAEHDRKLDRLVHELDPRQPGWRLDVTQRLIKIEKKCVD